MFEILFQKGEVANFAESLVFSFYVSYFSFSFLTIISSLYFTFFVGIFFLRSRSFCVFSPKTADTALSVFPSGDSTDGDDDNDDGDDGDDGDDDGYADDDDGDSMCLSMT